MGALTRGHVRARGQIAKPDTRAALLAALGALVRQARAAPASFSLPDTNRTHISPSPRKNRTHISPSPRKNRTHISPHPRRAPPRGPAAEPPHPLLHHNTASTPPRLCRPPRSPRDASPPLPTGPARGASRAFAPPGGEASSGHSDRRAGRGCRRGRMQFRRQLSRDPPGGARGSARRRARRDAARRAVRQDVPRARPCPRLRAPGPRRSWGGPVESKPARARLRGFLDGAA